jgi:hypothetical protein
MAGLAGPFTFEQYYQNTKETYERGILDSFIENESIVTRFSISTFNSQKRIKKRFIGGMPSPTYGPIGFQPPTPFVSDFQDYTEGCYLLRDIYDYDKLFETDANYIENDVHQKQIDLYMKGRVFDLNSKFFNNTHSQSNGDNNAPEGLKARLAYGKFGNVAACTVQSGAVFNFGGWSAASSIRFAFDLQLLFNHMGNPSGDGTVVFLNPQTWNCLNSTVKTGGQAGGFTTSKDAFDREIIKFKGATLCSTGYNAPTITGAQTTPVVSSAQDINGWDAGDPLYNPTGALYTTVYVVDGSDADKFSTWQMSAPSVMKVQVSGTWKKRIMLDQTFGMWNPDNRAIGRLVGVLTNGPSYD